MLQCIDLTFANVDRFCNGRVLGPGVSRLIPLGYAQNREFPQAKVEVSICQDGMDEPQYATNRWDVREHAKRVCRHSIHGKPNLASIPHIDLVSHKGYAP